MEKVGIDSNIVTGIKFVPIISFPDIMINIIVNVGDGLKLKYTSFLKTSLIIFATMKTAVLTIYIEVERVLRRTIQ